MHVVQIGIMHINALKTQLMHKKCANELQKIPKFNTTLMLFYVDTREKIEIKKRQRLLFRPERWNVPYRNHQACCEKLWFVRSLYPNMSLMGQKNYDGILMLLHDSMPCFMNYRRVLDLLEFKNKESQCLWPSDGGRVFDTHSHFLHGT